MSLRAYLQSGAVVVAFTLDQRLGGEAQVLAPILVAGLVGRLASTLSERAYRVLRWSVVGGAAVAGALDPTRTVLFYAGALALTGFGVHWHRKRRKKGSAESDRRR